MKKGKKGSQQRREFNNRVGSYKQIKRVRKDSANYSSKRIDTRQARRDGLFNELEAPKIKYTPEQRLLVEILRRAIWDLSIKGLTHKPSSLETGESVQLTRNSAREYLMCDEFYEFSFAWVCEQLNLDHEKLRNKLIERNVLNIDDIAN